MHTRQGVAEPAPTQNNRPSSQPGDLFTQEYPFAHVLGEGPNRSRITVGPYWLEYLIRLYVCIGLDAIALGFLALLASVVTVALLVGGQ